jgi:hypothetical protein
MTARAPTMSPYSAAKADCIFLLRSLSIVWATSRAVTVAPFEKRRPFLIVKV